jgi:Na+-translocating ferredoxin:NAD+ oxidoreductase RNF subunit RnfB
MQPALIKLAVGALAVLGVIALLVAIGLAVAAYKSWLQKNREDGEVPATLTGDPCASCALTGRETCPAGAVKDGSTEDTTTNNRGTS